MHDIGFLNKEHEKNSFSCSNADLDNYLKQYASQDMRRKISTTYIMSPKDNPTKVIGYYTLSQHTIRYDEIQKFHSRKLPKHPLIPASLIGRLAVDENYQKQGYGEQLLYNALTRLSAISKKLASYAVLVDAIDTKAAMFYEKYGFAETDNDCNRLYISMDLVDKLLTS